MAITTQRISTSADEAGAIAIVRRETDLMRMAVVRRPTSPAPASPRGWQTGSLHSTRADARRRARGIYCSGARLVGPVLAGLELLDEIVVGNERSRGADAVAVAPRDGAAEDGGSLESTGAEHGDRHSLFDLSRVGQVGALNVIRGNAGLQPQIFEHRARHGPTEKQQVAQAVLAAGGELLVYVPEHVERQIASRRILRVRESAPCRHVNGVDPCVDQPFANLNRVVDRIARPLELQERQVVVVVRRADLHLQVEVVADLLPDRLDDLDNESGAVL